MTKTDYNEREGVETSVFACSSGFQCFYPMASNMVHLDKLDLYDLQHGFLVKRSCGTQQLLLTMLFEDLSRNTSAGKQTDLVLLDFSNA